MKKVLMMSLLSAGFMFGQSVVAMESGGWGWNHKKVEKSHVRECLNKKIRVKCVNCGLDCKGCATDSNRVAEHCKNESCSDASRSCSELCEEMSAICEKYEEHSTKANRKAFLDKYKALKESIRKCKRECKTCPNRKERIKDFGKYHRLCIESCNDCLESLKRFKKSLMKCKCDTCRRYKNKPRSK